MLARALFNPMTAVQLTMGPAGWASIAARSVLSQAVNAAIQHFGSQLGLPQSAISLMQAGAGSSLGSPGGLSWRDAIQNFNRMTNASPFNAARNERTAQDTYDKVFDSVGKIMKQSCDEANGTVKTSGKNWIRVLVEALGKRLDKLANEMDAGPSGRHRCQEIGRAAGGGVGIRAGVRGAQHGHEIRQRRAGQACQQERVSVISFKKGRGGRGSPRSAWRIP